MPTNKLILIVFASLIVLSLRIATYYQDAPTYKDGQEIIIQVTLNEEPKLSNRGQQFLVKTSQNQRIFINTGVSKLYHYGDRLAIKGKLQVKKMDNNYLLHSMYFPEIVKVQSDDNPILKASRWVRQDSSRLFERTLPPISSDLLSGIVFGAKGDFPQSFKESLQTTGVLHVIAASGMNVSFFTGAVMFSLGAVLKRRLALVLSIFAVIFYSFLVGFEPSILRASAMAIIAFTASFFGRQNLALLALFITGFVMLLFQPAFLFDVGFQLSFLATLGILMVGERLGKLGWLGWLREDFRTTLSAQIATFPILLGTFGKVGVLGIVVNLLVLWTVPILMLLGSLSVLGGLIFDPLGQLFLILSLPFLLFFEYVVGFFGELGWVFAVESFPWQFGVGYYLILGALLISLRKNKSKPS